MKVCNKQCDECLFSSNRIVSAERAKEIVAECLKKDEYFICHKSSMQGGKVCCRGFFDKHKLDVIPTRISEIFGITEFVKVEPLNE